MTGSIDERESPTDAAQEFTIPVVEETVSISPRRIETGRVHIRKHAVTEPARIQTPLKKESVEIERVTIDREIDTLPEIRFEDGVTVIPVVEEVIEIRKRLVLKEEIRVRVIEEETLEEIETVVRKERVEIQRTPAPDSPQHNRGDESWKEQS